MKYDLDLSKLSLGDYQEILKKQNLLPGRRILWQDIDGNFAKIGDCGVNDIAQLKKALSSPVKIAAFAEKSGIAKDYLTILKREIGSLEQKPVALANFPGVDTALVSRLQDSGIKTSKDYLESNPTQKDELFSLCDLVRINGIGAVAARAFYEAGYHSVADVAGADSGEMLGKVTAVNRVKQYYKANLGEKDMQFCIDAASLMMRYADE